MVGVAPSGPQCAADRGQRLPLGRSADCADGVRGCPCDVLSPCLRSRTYSGQRPYSGPRLVTFAQVRWYIEVQAGEYCKTVGSAYVGSNPTPAT